MRAGDIIIYSDMDGTALTDWSMGPYVPEDNLAQIRELTARGGIFSAASGRQAPDILGFFPDVEFRAPLVCANGAVVYDAAARRVLRKVPVPQAYKEEAMAYTLAHPGVWLAAADADRIYQVLTGDAQRDNQLDDLVRETITAGRFLEGEYVKACYVLEEGGDMDRLKAETGELPSAGLVTCVQSGPRYLEAVERSVSKAGGIRFALEAAGLTGRTLVCVGDYFNDLAMLNAADIAACPCDSPEEIRGICQIVTRGHNEGAVGDLIRRLQLW